jgi:hypothetical protein
MGSPQLARPCGTLLDQGRRASSLHHAPEAWRLKALRQPSIIVQIAFNRVLGHTVEPASPPWKRYDGALRESSADRGASEAALRQQRMGSAPVAVVSCMTPSNMQRAILRLPCTSEL